MPVMGVSTGGTPLDAGNPDTSPFLVWIPPVKLPFPGNAPPLPACR